MHARVYLNISTVKNHVQYTAVILQNSMKFNLQTSSPVLNDLDKALSYIRLDNTQLLAGEFYFVWGEVLRALFVCF